MSKSKASKKVDKKTQNLVETELRRGTSKSRIATLLDIPYDEAVEVIKTVKENVRPEVGDVIQFTFRDYKIVGEIEKLLNNSAIVKIFWDQSDKAMLDVLEERTAVNFKDIDNFVEAGKKETEEDK